MSLSDILVKVLGIILAIVGLGLTLSSVGVSLFGIASLSPWWLGLLIGLLLIGAGIYIIRGGNITL